MKEIVKILEKEFSAESNKKAYLKACKWLAINVLNKIEIIGDLTYGFKKVETDGFPTFTLEIYGVFDDDKLQKSFCRKCQEFHHAFFINQQYNCNSCNMIALREQKKKELRVRRQFVKNEIRENEPDIE